MKYIHFVIIFLCVFFLCISPVAGIRTNAMIHYSQPQVSLQDEICLEQGYSLRIHDIGSNSGDIWIDLYQDGEKVELDDTFAKEDEPLDYLRSVAMDGGDEGHEVDYLILRITPEGDVDRSDDGVHSTIHIEQYLDPVEDVDDYLILDRSYSLKSDSELELSGLYTLKATDVDDDEVSLELRFNGDLLKEDEVREEEYFYYTVYQDTEPQTVFLANVEAFFEVDGGYTVFLNHVSLQQYSGYGSDEVPEGIDVDVSSPVGGSLKAGRIAIITYYLDDHFSEASVLVDGDILDTRKEVSPGRYKAVTEELDAGIHKITLVTTDDEDEVSHYSEEFSVSVNIKDNITGSIAEIANSAAEGFVNMGNESSSQDASDTFFPSMPTSSNISNVIALIVTVGVFIFLFMFFNKFR